MNPGECQLRVKSRCAPGGSLQFLWLAWLAICTLGRATSGQEVKVDPYAALNAVEAVRQGNKLLKDDHPKAALEAYKHAKKLQPEAPEIHFAEGLAHFRLEEFDRAREAFMRASAAKRPGLQNDALYGLATCDHAEALREGQDPKAALSMLESAMQQYHHVLSRDPAHDAARDANARAAAMWRQLKQQLQPQQQQECDGDSDENQDQKEGEKDQKQGDKKDQKNEQQPSESSQDQDQDKQKAEDSSDAQENKQQQQDQKKKQESKPQDKENGQTEAQQAKASESNDDTSREQAQRRLREMVQALQQRKKAKPERVPVAAPIPVDKDW